MVEIRDESSFNEFSGEVNAFSSVQRMAMKYNNIYQSNLPWLSKAAVTLWRNIRLIIRR